MNTEDFLEINGYPNEFWGWGGEDDCFGYRIRNSSLEVARAPNNTSTYTMLRHETNEAGNEINPCRQDILNIWQDLWMLDGLNSLKYRIISFDLYRRFYHIYVDIEPPSDTCEILKRNLTAENFESNYSLREMAPVPNFTIIEHCGSYDRLPTMNTLSNMSHGELIILMVFVTIVAFSAVHMFRKLSRIRMLNVGYTEGNISNFKH